IRAGGCAMRLTRDAMIELMALADGELEGEARTRAEKLVAESDEARRILQSMRSPALGTFVADSVAARSPAADGIADAVMARLGGAAGVGMGVGLGVGDGAAHGGGTVVRLGDARVRARRGSRIQLAVGGALGVLALAAAVALWVQSRVGSDFVAPVASV